MGQFTEAKVGPLSIAQLLILLGAIIGIIAVFLNWFTLSIEILGFKESMNFTGWDYAFNSDVSTSDFQRYCPLIAWIFAIIALIVTVLPLAKVNVLDSKISGIIVIVCALLMIVFSIVWGMWGVDDYGIKFKMLDYAAIGLWLMIVGGVLALIGGALPLIDKN